MTVGLVFVLHEFLRTTDNGDSSKDSYALFYLEAVLTSRYTVTQHKQLHALFLENLMRLRIIASSLAIVLLAGGLAGAKDTPDEQREKTRKMAAQTLEDLYKLQPTAKSLIQKSAGYAVFDNMGANLLLVSTARGSGIAVNAKTSQDTFMKMVSAGAGLGVGVKDYRVVFAFETEPALSKFLDSGWDGSAQTDAAAKTSNSGGAYSGAATVAPGVWVYQITKKGLALQLTLQGTKYYKDDELNK